MLSNVSELPVIDIRDLSFSFPGPVRILEDVKLQVPKGDFLAIIGPNGGGKTTLLRLILGLLRPDSGTVSVLGTSPAGAVGRIGYVPQMTGFERSFPVSVMDAVLMGRLHVRGVLRGYTDADRSIALEKMELLRIAELSPRRIGDLSGGQRQRVLIARALCSEPELLLLDEPAAGIDRENQENFYHILSDINIDVTIVMATHDIGAISSYVSRIGCMNVQLFLHDDGISEETMARVYGCPFELITHGVPHRVLGKGQKKGDNCGD
jgi:zinc transport system ATP-binding protein